MIHGSSKERKRQDSHFDRHLDRVMVFAIQELILSAAFFVILLVFLALVAAGLIVLAIVF